MVLLVELTILLSNDFRSFSGGLLASEKLLFLAIEHCIPRNYCGILQPKINILRVFPLIEFANSGGLSR